MSVMAFMDGLLEDAGQLLVESFGQVRSVSAKADRSLVTDADLACDRLICQQIRSRYPSDAILTEESGEIGVRADRSGATWIVDPLDGTTNFAHGYPFFSVSIARGRRDSSGLFQVEAAGIIDPMRQVKYMAERGGGAYRNSERMQVTQDVALADAFLVTGFYYQRGQELVKDLEIFGEISDACHAVRRDGSAALDLALVASGVFHGFWERGLQPWDVAAGSLLIEEAQGVIRNYQSPSKQASFDVFGHGLIAGGTELVGSLMNKVKFAKLC